MRKSIAFPPLRMIVGTFILVGICLAAHVWLVYFALMTAPVLDGVIICAGANPNNYEILLCERSWRLWLEFHLWLPGLVTVFGAIALGEVIFHDWEMVKARVRNPREKINRDVLTPLIYRRRMVIVVLLVVGVIVSFFVAAGMHTYLLNAPDQELLAPHIWPRYIWLHYGLLGLTLFLLLSVLGWEWGRAGRYWKEIRYLWYQFACRTLTTLDAKADYMMQVAQIIPRTGRQRSIRFLLAFRRAPNPDTSQLSEARWDRGVGELKIKKLPSLTGVVQNESIQEAVITNEYYMLLGADKLYRFHRSSMQEFSFPVHDISLMCALNMNGELVFCGSGGLRGGHIETLSGSPVQEFILIVNPTDPTWKHLRIWNCAYTGRFFSVVETSTKQVVLQCQKWDDLGVQWRLSANLFAKSDAANWGKFGGPVGLSTVSVAKGVVDAVVLHGQNGRYWLTGFAEERSGRISFNFELAVAWECTSLCVDPDSNIWIWGREGGDIVAYRIPRYRLRWKRWLYGISRRFPFRLF